MTTKIGAGVYVGGYIDGKPGAILLADDRLAHLDPDQCAAAARILTTTDPDLGVTVAHALTHLDPTQRPQLAGALTEAAEALAVTGACIVKALTVQQPWAWAIIHGGKDVENRTVANQGTTVEVLSGPTS